MASERPARVRILGYSPDGRAVTVTETEPHWTLSQPTTPRTVETKPAAQQPRRAA